MVVYYVDYTIFIYKGSLDKARKLCMNYNTIVYESYFKFLSKELY